MSQIHLSLAPALLIRWAYLWVAVGIGFTLSGCATVTMAPEKSDALTQLTTYSLDDFNADLKLYNANQGIEANRKFYRNRIVTKIGGAIYAHFMEYSTDSFTEQGWTDTALDAAVIGLGAAGSLTGGEGLKNIILATTGALTGTRSAFSKNFYAENSPKVIRLRNIALMTAKWNLITPYLDVPDSKFDLDRFVPLLAAYYNAGTVQAAFDDIDAESGIKSKDAESDQDAQLVATAVKLGAQVEVSDSDFKVAEEIAALMPKVSPSQAAAILKQIPDVKRTDSNPATAPDDLRTYLRSLRLLDAVPRAEKMAQLDRLLKDALK